MSSRGDAEPAENKKKIFTQQCKEREGRGCRMGENHPPFRGDKI
mgnify:CR=1 FL=1